MFRREIEAEQVHQATDESKLGQGDDEILFDLLFNRLTD
jgi:hypothetical protein